MLTCISYRILGRRRSVNFLAWLRAVVITRKERRQLAGLEAHQLRDIGISIETARGEAARSSLDLPERLKP